MRQSIHDTNMPYIDTCTIVIDIFYIGRAGVLVDGIRFGTTKHNKVHGANMGPTWVLSAPDGPHVGPLNLSIREGCVQLRATSSFG